jgi:FlaA1/EpsC-like NDP-sugar epimerase
MTQKTIPSLKRFFAFFHDLLVAIFALFAAYALRFNFEIPAEHLSVCKYFLPYVVSFQLIVFYLFGLYKGIWRFASVIDLKRIISAATLTTLLLTAILFMLKSNFIVPRSVLIIDLILLILIMGGSRFLYRVVKDYQLYGLTSLKGEPVIIFGTGQAAAMLVKELSQTDQYHMVGFLDKDNSLHGREISGIKVLGSISDLSEIHKKFGLKHIIIAAPNINYSERHAIFVAASKININILVVPAVNDLISGRLTVSQIRPVDVEDLLGRGVVNLDNSGLQHLLSNHVVMVTGAGGSIGSELCQQILKFNPSQLICFDISEFALYQLEQRLTNLGLESKLLCVVGDVKNANRIDQLLIKYRPKVVFHAAAYKHVPMMENNNVSESFQNNVLGTYVLGESCKKANVDKFVLISTDKAVNPTNIMGATKRLAEMVCQGLQEENGTRFVMVRFGNVLGSSGSVIPKFRDQIKAGGPVTVTHPEVTRYFMSIPEAAQLVMQAGLMGKGGEIFVMDMGESVRIIDLAKDMIRLSGFDENEIKIEFTGLRPGEKLYEELLAEADSVLPSVHEKLKVAKIKSVNIEWLEKLISWVNEVQNKDEATIKKELINWVPEYTLYED